MQNLSYAFRFIRASFSIAFKKIQLQEQWVYIAVGNLVFLLIWFLPLGLVLGLMGLRPVGMFLIGLIGVFMLFSFRAWREITREPASRVMVGLFQENPGDLEEISINEENLQTAKELQERDKTLTKENSQIEGSPKDKQLFKHWEDILALTLILPGMRFIFHFRKLLWPESKSQHAWLTSFTLLVPVISVENRDIKEAVMRINQMIDDHLLRFQPGLVKVDLVGSLVQWALSLIGILVGVTVAILIIDPLASDPWQRILGSGIGLLIAWFFITTGNIFNAYTRSFYHTALYQWVRNVEEARKTGETAKAVPPNILRQAMGTTIKK
ncbi:MAG: hypothetical protein SVP52_05700 [Chloroflexota bacterium]|nr:hypothetical protein [Chloroflexota bacterium]